MSPVVGARYSPADDSGLPHVYVGLTQILGELPTVLDMKYPVLFRGFLDWLAIFKFDVFKNNSGFSNFRYNVLMLLLSMVLVVIIIL